MSVGIEKEGGRVYKNAEHHKHGGEQYSPGARGDTKKNRDTGRKMSCRGCIGPPAIVKDVAQGITLTLPNAHTPYVR